MNNKPVNQSENVLIEALKQCITEDGAACYRTDDPRVVHRRFNAINDIAKAAIEQQEKRIQDNNCFDAQFQEAMKALRWIVNNPYAHPTNMVRAATEAISDIENNSRLSACASDMLEEIISQYQELANVSNNWEGRNTPKGQAKLCRLRDLIANATGRTGEEVQNDYG